jgi:hypothetical protein
MNNEEKSTTIQYQQQQPSVIDSSTAKKVGKNLLAGGLARMTAASIMFPIDVVKTRLQFQTDLMNRNNVIRKYYTSSYHAFISIIKDEGIRGLYKGLPIRLLYVAPAAAVSFTVYEQFTQAMHNRSADSFSWKTPVITLAAGAFARVLGTACRTPLDILKQQLQIEGQLSRTNQSLRNLGLYNTLTHIVKVEGFKGFFSGYGVTLLRDAPFAAIYFTTYDIMKHIVLKLDENNESGNVINAKRQTKQLLAGACSGAIATTCTIPIDVVKTRLQTQGKLGERHYDGVRDAFIKIYREEGWKAFTKGLGPRLAYIMPASALTFTIYEILKPLFNFDYATRSDSI